MQSRKSSRVLKVLFRNNTMTTSILAQKLVSIKLGKCEFERVKWMRYCNASKMNKAAHMLKKILNEQISLKTCRLCLTPGGESIFDCKELNLANNIRTIVGVQVYEGDGKPQHICHSCKETVQKAAELRKSTDIVQWRLQQELEMIEESTTVDWEPESSKIHGGYFVETTCKVVRQWKCSRCSRVFKKRELFEEHDKMENCRREKYFVCEKCGAEAKTHYRLRKHWLIHSEDLPVSCPRCPFRSRTKLALNEHIRAGHAGLRPQRCPYCPATFRDASTLSAHKRKHFPPAFHCQVCQRGFKFKQSLQNHMGTQHSNTKPYSCVTCGETFSIRKMMLIHELKKHNRPKMRPGTIPGYKPMDDTT